MSLNYDFGGQIRKFKKNHFEKIKKANRIFFLQKMLDFSSINCFFWRQRFEVVSYDMGQSVHANMTIGRRLKSSF